MFFDDVIICVLISGQIISYLYLPGFRCACIDVCQAQQMCQQWSVERDGALVAYHNHLCRHLGITPARLHPHEVYLTEAELTSADYSFLQGKIVLICNIIKGKACSCSPV